MQFVYVKDCTDYTISFYLDLYGTEAKMNLIFSCDLNYITFVQIT